MIKAGFDLVGVNKQCNTCAALQETYLCGEARSCALVGKTNFLQNEPVRCYTHQKPSLGPLKNTISHVILSAAVGQHHSHTPATFQGQLSQTGRYGKNLPSVVLTN